MNTLREVEDAIRALVPADGRPVVVHSSVLPFLSDMRRADRDAVESVLSCVLDALGERTVLMPTFTRGYAGGVCNLDTAPSITGVLTECYRKRPGVRRTLSAFFSYAFSGERHPDLPELRPEHAWGPGSVYEWMEREDVRFLVLGTHPTHCSYFHRLEWLARDVITFRHDKTFSGTIVREGRSVEMTETLFVRGLDPPVVIDFSFFESVLRGAGMAQRTVAGAPVTTFSPAVLVETVLPILRRDPFAIVKNRHLYEQRAGG